MVQDDPKTALNAGESQLHDGVLGKPGGKSFGEGWHNNHHAFEDKRSASKTPRKKKFEASASMALTLVTAATFDTRGN